MKKQLLAFAVAAVLAMPLAACGSGSTSSSSSSSSSSGSTATVSDEKDAAYYAGTWRGSVETTGTSVYGTTGGSEQMIDVILNEDGTLETAPCKNHEDLLTTTGTWTLDGSTVTLTFADGSTATMTIENDNAMTGDPKDFGIDGFDSLNFALY